MRIASSLLVLAPLLASSALYAACGGGTVSGLEPDDDDAGSSSGNVGTSSSSSGNVESDAGDGGSTSLPNLADLEAGKYTFIKTGGDTTCALGTDYGFAIRPGDPTKVVIEFEGGGACFNDATCSGAASKGGTAYFKDFTRADDYAGNGEGLRDHTNAANPIKDWTHVVVPYCSGDVHWGDKQSVYKDTKTGEDITIEHRGVKNTSAVLDYVYAQLAAPEHVFVTGCSAGGYGSIWHSAKIREHYTSAKFRHFSDSAAGVFPGTYFETLANTWGLASGFPTNIGDAASFKRLAYLYEGIATKYPDVLLSQYNVAADTTQALFLAAMGGSGWTAGMQANIGELVDNVPQFREYQSPGNVHCIIEKNDFYSKDVSGVKLTDWVGQIVNDETPDNVNCPTCSITTTGDAGN